MGELGETEERGVGSVALLLREAKAEPDTTIASTSSAFAIGLKEG
jgi:hypothetical protein